MTEETPSRDVLLAAFASALEKSGGNYALLKEWRDAYPAHAEDLTQFALNQFVYGNNSSDEVSAGEAGETLAAGRRALAQLRPKPTLTNLYGAQTGRTAQTLSQTLKLPVSLIAKLENRMLDAATLPKRLIAELAAAIEQTQETVITFLRQGPRLPANALYRSNVTPQLQPIQTFDDAFALASPAERAAWEDDLGLSERLGLG